MLPAFQKQHFASLERIGVPQKEEKCHFSFSLIKRHFIMHFYVAFYFFKLPFDFVCRPKAAFCKAKVHMGTPKEGKISVPFFSNQIAFFLVFLRAISFFKVFFNFAFVAKAAFCKSKAHSGTPKGGKMSLLFFSNKTAFFSCIFTCHFIFSNSLLILSVVQMQHFARLKWIGVRPKEEKCQFLFS